MISQDYTELPGGFTNNFVRRVALVNVVKSGPTVENECKWYRAYRDKNDIPKVYSADHSGITMEYIPSDGTFFLDEMLQLIEKYKEYPRLNDQTFYGYRHRIKEHLIENPIYGGAKLLVNLSKIDLPATFCHGDLSVNNIIANTEGLKLIDPNYHINFGSYWLDYAKLAFSLKFYRGDVHLYNEVLARTGVPKVLIVSECVRVATYRRGFNFISENLINEL